MGVRYSNGTVLIWSLESVAAPRQPAGHELQISDIAFSPDGRRVATASFDGTLRIFDLDSEEPQLFLQPNERITGGIYWTGDDRLLTHTEEGIIREWHLRLEDRDRQVDQHAIREFTPEERLRFAGQLDFSSHARVGSRR